MIRYVGASAIADACHVSTETVYRWRKALLRGEEAPLVIRSTVTGRIWVSEEDVDALFSGPATTSERGEAEVDDILRRLEGR